MFLLPRFCMKSKCNMYIHIPSSPSPHFSFQAPKAPPKWRRLSWDTFHLPMRRLPVGLAVVLTPGGCPGAERRWRGRRAALMDYPSCPREGTLVSISASSVWQRTCEDSGHGKKRAGLGVCV